MYILWFWIFVSFVALKGYATFVPNRWTSLIPLPGRFELFNELAVSTAIGILLFRLYRKTDVRIEKFVLAFIQLDYLVVAAFAFLALIRASFTVPHKNLVTLFLGVVITFLTGIRTYAVTHTKGNQWTPSA